MKPGLRRLAIGCGGAVLTVAAVAGTSLWSCRNALLTHRRNEAFGEYVGWMWSVTKTPSGTLRIPVEEKFARGDRTREFFVEVLNEWPAGIYRYRVRP